MKQKLLDEATRKKIYNEYMTTDMSYDQLAKKYDVSCKTIYNTCRRFRDADKKNPENKTNSRAKSTNGVANMRGGNVNNTKRTTNKANNNTLENYMDEVMRNRNPITGEKLGNVENTEKLGFDNNMQIPVYSPYSAQGNTTQLSYYSIPSMQTESVTSIEQTNPNTTSYNNIANVSNTTKKTNNTSKAKKEILNLLQQDIALHMSNDI